MIRRTLLIALCLSLAALAPQAAHAQTVADKALQGLITEVGEGYFLLQDESLGPVHVTLDDALTVYEGIAAKDTLAVGQYVLVAYNGVMTRSIPPQVTALKISCFVLRATVTEVLHSGVVVQGDEIVEKAIVHLDENAPPVYLGMLVTVYYSGVMALSMPPQISALHVVVPTLEGTASGISNTGFLLTTMDGQLNLIALDANTRRTVMLEEGLPVRVYYSGTATEGESVLALEVAAWPQDMVSVPF
jgi:uncharacterized protein YdbL (DUF1318 family)